MKMDNPFDNMMDNALDGDLAASGDEAFEDQGDGMADAFEDDAESADFADGTNDAGDGFEGDGVDQGDGFEDSADGMALWDAFEEEVADGLDAAEEDEFLGRLLGGLGRAGGLVQRGAAGVARGARQASQIAGQAGRVAARVTPAANAAARLARMLGAGRVASGLDAVGRGARSASQLARQASGFAASVGRGATGVGQAAASGQALLAQLSQLIGAGGNEFDDFDAMADLFEDGVDEALPSMVGLAARAAARGLGFRNVAQLSVAGRRALVRGVGAAARELMRGRDRGGLRQLPRLAQAAGRTATRTTPTPQAAVQTLRRGLPRTARNVARNPQVLPPPSQQRQGPAPLARPNRLGRGMPSSTIAGPRTFRIDGPVTLSITPR
jgi:hypothetical protein